MNADSQLDDLTNRIVEFVKSRDRVTFVEIEKYCSPDGFKEYGKGEFDLYLSVEDNIILWPGLSEEMINSINISLRLGLMHWEACSHLFYLFDGVSLKFPIAKKPRKYKKTHWIPVCFRYGPGPKP